MRLRLILGNRPKVVYLDELVVLCQGLNVTPHIVWAGTTLSEPPSVEQGRAYAAEYKLLGNNSRNSARRSAVLANIPRSWAALANQLESLAVIEKSEAM